MRSWLFVPGDSEKKLAKGFDTGADVVILDLEDSVAPARKETARGLVREAIAAAPDRTRVAVRVNPLGTEDAARDLAVLEAGPGFVALPKCGGGQDATELAARLSVAEAEAGLVEGTVRIMAIATETAASL
ncbi:MAG: aldolase/citrate lyase family protein, partial [Pseudomonadota bacterium]